VSTTEPTSQYVIQTQNLSKDFKGVKALKGLNLTVSKHSIFGFLGPNGAGKTTTIKLLLGLAKPTGGSASVFGLDSVGDSTQIRRRVGYLAQDPRYYEYMSARETLRFTARFFYTGPRDAIEARIQETLVLVGLDDKADRPIKGFSGGERQRLGIAQAQINYPDLLILDEPAASLDPMGRRDVLEVMERLRKHTTIFYSTHILADVQRVSDTVAILNHGQLLAQAPIESLLSGASAASVYSLALSGNTAAARERVVTQPWVTALTIQPANGHLHWEVSVSDEAAAETRLVSLVQAAGDVRVAEFSRKRYDLEEVFMNIVSEDGRGK
jgi:ABC-2 type transport system ATP-binding protein